jgi:hypothetical protein
VEHAPVRTLQSYGFYSKTGSSMVTRLGRKQADCQAEKTEYSNSLVSTSL